MCDDCAPRTGLSRRQFLGTAPLVVSALALPLPLGRLRAVRPITVAGLGEILPRETWASGLEPTGAIPAEPDVRFLLVHHTVNPNSYAEADVAGMFRSIFSFHTSAEKGWPDVAYNFFVDRFGRIWEGRKGSLAGVQAGTPVAGDATGGNQGSSQLCCFLGDHSGSPPEPPAEAAMGRLLGWLAAQLGIDVRHGQTVTFTSRGSNLHPAGATVQASTISGHRDMSQTACPGEAAYALVTNGRFSQLASGVAAPSTTAPPDTTAPPGTAPPPPSQPPAEEPTDAGRGGRDRKPATGDREPPTTTTTTTPITTTTTTPTTTTTTTTSTTADPVTTTTTGDESAMVVVDEDRSGDGGLGSPTVWAVGSGTAVVAAAAAVGVIRRRQAVAEARHYARYDE